MASSRSSGVLSADTLVFTGANRVNALTVLTDGTNAATVYVRDGTTVSDTIKMVGTCLGASLSNHYVFENPVYFEQGLFVDLTGTGASCILYFGG